MAGIWKRSGNILVPPGGGGLWTPPAGGGGGGTYSHGDDVVLTDPSISGSAWAQAFAGGAQGPIETTTVGQIPANTLGGVNPQSAATNPTDGPATTNNSWSWRRFSQRPIVANDATRGKVIGGAYSGFGSNPDVAMEYRFPGTIANGGRVYTSFRTKVSYSPGSAGQHKILRLCGGSESAIEDTLTNFVFSNQQFNGSVSMLANTANSGTNQQTWYNTDVSQWDDTNTVWQFTELFLQMSSGTGVRDGQIFIRNFTGGSVPTPANPSAFDGNGNPLANNLNSQWLSRPSNNSSALMMSFLWENYVGNSWTAANLFQDDYYVNTSDWRRLQLWNTASAATATVREAQELKSLGSGTLTFRLNEGGLAPGDYYATLLGNTASDSIVYQELITLV